MAKLNVAPTKSNYLTLTRQLTFAEEGFELLEQKRQILVYELMSRLGRARDVERRMAEAIAPAFAALRESTLDSGTAALDSAAATVRLHHELRLEEQHVMGIALPKIALQLDSTNKTHFGVSTTTGNADKSTRFFMQLLPLLAELAELENSVMRLARELRKTQRRCNALSRVFIPEHSKTIDYISATLEERERESFIVLRMIKERLSPTTVTNNGGANE